MEFVNLTRFQFAYLPGRNNFPGHSLTLIVKGTFKLRPADVAIPVDDQPFPTGDELYPDDEEGTGAPRYENDFAPFKPRTDLLLVGNCYAPGQTPVPYSRASFRVGNHLKSVNVIGDRRWKGRLGGWTDPEPFAVMPIRYENSFGGEGFAGNPAGKGYQSKKGADDSKKDMLPNIEDAQRIIRGKGDQPDPVGFGPLNRMWQERFAKVGTYKGDWKETRFPAFPSDFDWAFFNAAQPDLRVEGYLRGDEDLTMENLHPEIPLYSSKLPGIRIRCFVEERQIPGAAEAPFHEVKMNLDTLWVDMESEVLTLVWRGVAEVSSEEFEEIGNLLVCAEQVDDTPVAVENHRDILHQALAALEREWSGEDEDTEEETAHDDDESGLQADQDAPDEDEAKVDPEIVRIQAQMAAMQPPEPTLPPPAEADEQEKTREQILAEAGADADGDLDEEAEIPRPIGSREDVEEMIAGKRSLSGLDLRNIDLSNLIANEVDFSGANLSGVCLAGSSLVGSLLVEANLEGADLSECNLTAANLSLANIQAARLIRSVLCDADFTGSQMMRADLSSAEAKDAIFASAQLEQGHLEGIKAPGADFSEAKLNGACLDAALLDDTSFAGASVHRASFKGASLRDSDWAGVAAQKVNLDQAEMAGFRATEGCDFFEATFREIKGKESNWQGADLTGADFSYAEMEGADFTKACLQRTCLEAADMAHAKFHKADLEGAKLVTMNLFQGSLEKANLKDADLSGSNMYGVEFQDAIFHNTVGKGTNLKMTKQDKG